LWISPVQVAVLPITDAVNEYAKNIFNELKNSGIRVIFDERNEKIGYKIREAENKKVPYMVVLGEKEKESGNITVREHKKGDIGKFGLKEFIENLKFKISQKLI
jgi:threonyl-tRNA synthetase